MFLTLLDPGLFVFDPSGEADGPAAIREARSKAYARHLDTVRARALVATLLGARLVVPEGWSVCSLPALTVIAEAWRTREAVWHEMKNAADRRGAAPLSPFAIGYFRAGGAADAPPGANRAEPAESFLTMLHRRLAPEAAPLEGYQPLNSRDDPEGGADRRRLLREIVGRQLSRLSGADPLSDVALDPTFYESISGFLPDENFADGLVALSHISQRAGARERVYLPDARGRIDRELPALLLGIKAEAERDLERPALAAAIVRLLGDLSRERTPISSFARVRDYLAHHDPEDCEALIGLARLVTNRVLGDQIAADLREHAFDEAAKGSPVLSRGRSLLASEGARLDLASGAVEPGGGAARAPLDWDEIWRGVWRLVLDRRHDERLQALRREIERVGPIHALKADAWRGLVEAVNAEVSHLSLSQEGSRLLVHVRARYERLSRRTALALAVSGFAFGEIAARAGASGAMGGFGAATENGLIVSLSGAALFYIVGLAQGDITTALLRRDERDRRDRALAVLRQG